MPWKGSSWENAQPEHPQAKGVTQTSRIKRCDEQVHKQKEKVKIRK